MKNKFMILMTITGTALAAWLLYSLRTQAGGPHHVALVCDGVPPPCYTTIQAAVDAAAPDDEIFVAEGKYVGTTVITKSLTVRGGYTTTNWATSYPVTQPTVLDGEGIGPVLLASDIDESYVFEGLHITGGNYAGNGGGIAAGGDVVLRDNVIFGNAATYGGGICLSASDASLVGNTIVSNSAHLGGGLWLDWSAAMLDSNIITNNVAANGGAGIVLYKSTATFTNTVIADNVSGLGLGVALHISFSSIELLHTTIARNVMTFTHQSGPCCGSGLFILTSGDVDMVNSIVSEHKIGACVPETFTPTLRMTNTLWYSNGVDFIGGVFHTMDSQGSPSFELDGYHLEASSMAIDKGIDVGVSVDVDGQRRAGIPDLGADECIVIRAWLPAILK